LVFKHCNLDLSLLGFLVSKFGTNIETAQEAQCSHRIIQSVFTQSTVAAGGPGDGLRGAGEEAWEQGSTKQGGIRDCLFYFTTLTLGYRYQDLVSRVDQMN
jgi:hypothetical protein